MNKLLYKDIVKGKQSIENRSVWNMDRSSISRVDVKLRIAIKRDSYNSQSFAKIEIFSRELYKWNFLESIHYSKMETLKGSYLDDIKAIGKLMDKDSATLLKFAADILM